MEKYILSLDQGTTSSRAILFDRSGGILASARKEFPQLFPQPGWVEHRPEDIWESQLEVAKSAIRKAGLSPRQIHAIGITNQRETILAWDKETGKAICNAIVWQDRRTADICRNLADRGYEEEIRGKTGLVIDSYFSATKIMWILENVNGARMLAEKNRLAVGTVDTWLVWKLTGGKKHVTDVTNASRTMAFNIHELSWDRELLDKFNIPLSVFPQVCSSSEVLGTTELFGSEIPVSGIAGDQQAALFGQMCTSEGMAKNTYGTGCFILIHTGEKACHSENKLLTTIALGMNGKTFYALEGSIFNAGTVVQWLRDGLGIIKSSAEIEDLASGVEDNGGVYFVPSFTGLAAPYWDPGARGMIAGITRGSRAGHIARAALEGIAFRTMEVLEAMEKDTGIPLKELRVDGGASVNNLLMQIQSDLIGKKIVRPVITETTALGAAYLAGLATGFWKDQDELKKQWQAERVFSPSGTNTETMKKEWKNAILKSLTANQ